MVKVHSFYGQNICRLLDIKNTIQNYLILSKIERGYKSAGSMLSQFWRYKVNFTFTYPRLVLMPKIDHYYDQQTIQGMRQHGCSECTNPQIFETSTFAPADFEASSTMCTQSSPGCICTRRSKFPTHSLLLDSKTPYNIKLFQLNRIFSSARKSA